MEAKVGANIKNQLVLILGILCVLFLIVAVSSCQEKSRFKKAKEKEINLRFDVEEQLKKVMDEKAAFEAKAKQLAQALEQQKSLAETAQKALVQEQLVNTSLKNEIVKISRLKDALEEDLKNALVAGKTDKNRK
jgi:succinate dehydrogenase/fumarate reductase flavoprotein subunit